MKCQDCTLLGQIPVSNMLKVVGSVFKKERYCLNEKVVGFFFGLIVRTQVRRVS